jgi:hypothetical protein
MGVTKSRLKWFEIQKPPVRNTYKIKSPVERGNYKKNYYALRRSNS